MDSFYVKSRMQEEDLKNYLYYNQYYSERYYIVLRAVVSIVIGLVAAFFSSDKLLTFIIISVVCLIVFFAFPWIQIKYKYKKIYIKNRSQAFSQCQMFEFSNEQLGIKSENEADYYYDKYENLLKAAETDTMFIISYSKRKMAVIVKEDAGKENVIKIRAILMSKLNDRYHRVKKF